MRLEVSLDTNQPGDIIALHQLAASLSGMAGGAAVEAPAAAPAPRQTKPAKDKEKPAEAEKTPTDNALPGGAAKKEERVTMEDVRAACAGKDLTKVKAIIASMGFANLAAVEEDRFAELLTEIKKLPQQ